MRNQESTRTELQGVVDEASKRLFDEAPPADEILRAVATITWIDEHKDKPPETEIPGVDQLGQWWQDQGAEMVHGGHEAVWNLFRHYFGSDRPATEPVLTNPKDGADLALEFFMSLYDKKIDANIIESGRMAWVKAHREGYDGELPLAPIVEAWQKSRPLPAKKYPTAIMPRYAGSVIEVAYTDVEAGSVLQPQEVERAFDALNNQPDLFPPPERRLPLIIPRVEGVKETDHQGQVSQEIRILHESYLATTGYDIDIKGILVAFEFDYFRDALYPGWRDKRNKQGKRVSFHTVNRDHIRESLDNTRKAYIEVPELGPLAPVVCRTPVEKLSRGKDKVVLHVIAPYGTRRGGLIIANTMRQLGFLGGRGSARKYAFYHALVQYWDDYGTQKGRITWPTIPQKLRDGEGRLIDEKGAVILDKNGKPETRWKKGIQVYDAKGEKIYEPNRDEQLARYPIVSRTELVRFFGMNRWSKTKALLDEMESQKVFVMQEADDGFGLNGYRFFPSIEHCIAYNDVRTSESRAR